MEAPPTDTGFGSRATNRGRACHRWPSVVTGESHAVVAATARAEARGELRNVLVGIVEEAAEDARRHYRAVGGVPRGRGRRGRSGWIPRYRRYAGSRCFQHSKLLPMVPPIVGRRAVPGIRLARLLRWILRRGNGGNGSGRYFRLLFIPGQRR